jgi:hypothetical protein
VGFAHLGLEWRWSEVRVAYLMCMCVYSATKINGRISAVHGIL